MSDPSVAAMTEMQWAFEYEALQQRRREDLDLLEAVFKGLRAMLTDLFGLDMARYVTPALDGADDDTRRGREHAPYVVPASFLWGRPDALEHYRKEAEREVTSALAAKDEAMDDFSDALLTALEKGGDITALGIAPPPASPPTDPAEREAARKAYWSSPEAEARLTKLGLSTARISPAVLLAPREEADGDG